jgi:hypothetical protein
MLHKWLEAQGGQSDQYQKGGNGRWHASSLILSEGWEINVPKFETRDAKLNPDYALQVVENVIRGGPTMLAVGIMSLFMSIT